MSDQYKKSPEKTVPMRRLRPGSHRLRHRYPTTEQRRCSYFFRFLRLAMKPTANKPAAISSAVPGSGVTVTAAKIDGVKQTAKMLIARSLNCELPPV